MTKINSIKDSQGTVHSIDGCLGFPSSKRIKFDFVPSGTVTEIAYTVPANGYVMFHGVASEGSSTASALGLYREDGLSVQNIVIASNCTLASPLLPILKGQKFTAHCTRCIFTRAVDGLYFYYALDSVEEE